MQKVLQEKRINWLILLFSLIGFSFIKSLTKKTIKNSLMTGMNSFTYASINSKGESEHYLKITGTGLKTVPSDLILLRLNVETLYMDQKESYLKNTLASYNLSNAFSQLNIPEKNITTKSYNIFKKFRSVQNATSGKYDEIFEGYKVSNKMDVSLSSLELVYELIDRALSIGNILIRQILFDYSRPLQNVLRNSLLPVAAKDAVDRAKLSADALKVTIDDVKSTRIYESAPIQLPPDYEENNFYLRSYYSSARIGRSGPQIFKGKKEIEVSIFVDFIISPSKK
jgi:uncharacterized protein YggE